MNEAPFNTPEEQPRIYTISEISQDIRAILESAFDRVWVEGEISNLRVASSQHAYFVLKDEKAQIRCVMFKGQRMGQKYKPEDGDHVLVCGRVAVYEARGEYQIIADRLEPRGLGALQKAFEQLQKKLAGEGLFDTARKRELPQFPWKIGIITSPTGAAVRDIINVITRRNNKVSILLHPVKVQGDGAAGEIAQAIQEMNRRNDIDVLIVGRGGGSIEDLWAFNEEIVARAIYASRIPVVSAVGHEIDFTIADFVADVRAATPSAAAELAVPLASDIIQNVRSLTASLLDTIQGKTGNFKERLRYLIDRRFFREPMQILQSPAQRVDDFTQRLLRGLGQWHVLQLQRLRSRVRQLLQASPEKALPRMREQQADFSQRLLRGLGQWHVLQLQRLRNRVRQLLQASPEKALPRMREQQTALQHRLIRQIRSLRQLESERFEGLVKNLNALSPLAILDRGYSICTLANNAIKSSAETQAGDVVQVRLAKGRLDCKVEKAIE
jgi:exodeoxyribonuclease VII large subunit